MHCPYCGSLVPAGVWVCPTCHQNLPSEVYKVSAAQDQSSPQAAPQNAEPAQAAPTQPVMPQAQQQPVSAQPAPAVQQSAPAVAQVPAQGTVPPAPAAPGVPGAPVAPAAPSGGRPSDFSVQFRTQKAWNSILISLAYSLGGVVVLALLGAIIASAIMSNIASGSISIGFFTWFVLFFLHASAGTISESGMSAAASLPVGLASVVLLLGAAFGAYQIAHRNGTRLKWVGAVSSAITGAISAVVFLLIGFVSLKPEGSAMNMIGMFTDVPTAHGASARTFFGALLLTGLGALVGYALADVAPGSKTVFSAFDAWRRRARGWARLLAEEFVVLGSVLAVSSLLILIFLIIGTEGGNAKEILAGVGFVFLPTVIVDVSSILMGGGVTAEGSASGLFGGSSSSYNGLVSLWTTKDYSNPTSWVFILLFLVFIAAALYVGCRAAARNIYDPARAQWKDTWQAPVFVLVLGLLVSFLFCNLSASGSILGIGGSASLMPTVWTPLLAAVWTFLIEVTGITFGQNIVRSQPNMWKFFVPGCVVGLTAAQSAAEAQAAAVAAANRAAARAAAAGATVAQTPVTTTAQAPEAAQAAGTAVPAADGQQAQALAAPAAQSAQTAQLAAGSSVPAQPAAVPPATGASSDGTATMAFAPAPAAPAAPAVVREHHPMSKKTKITLITVGAVVAVLAVLGITYTVLNNTVFNPTHQVEDYIQAISDGDFDKASRLVDPGVSDAQGRLLTNAAGKNVPSNLKSGVSLIRDARVQNLQDGENGGKTASISYTLDGSKETASVQIVCDGQTALIFPKWRISTPLIKKIAVSSNAGSGTFVINGITLTSKNAAASSNGESDFFVYPGRYSVTIPSSKYLAATMSSVTDGASTSVKAKFSSALRTEIDNQLKSKLDACVAQAVNQPDNCDFELVAVEDDDSDASYRNWKWSVKTYPTVGKVEFGDSDESDESESTSGFTGSFEYSNGETSVTYDEKWSDDSDWESENNDYNLSGSGTFTIKGDKVTIKIDDSSSLW